MSPHDQTLREAIDALAFYVGWAGGWLPFERRRGDRVRRFWREAGAPGLADHAWELSRRYGDEVWMGLPQRSRWNGGVGTATTLWAWADTGRQVELARKLKPHPSLVLQAGVRRLMFWPLEQPESFVTIQEANRRLSYAIGGRQKEGDPDKLWIPLPGTPVGRKIVRCARLTTDTHRIGSVVGRLREPPPKDAWLRQA